MTEPITHEEEAHLTKPRREGWDAAFRTMAERGDDALLDGDAIAGDWDEEEWDW
ncbi:MAG TPA: hypothetical protein VEX86_08560 [Longimicrobium sp.]|nr:hypothetical protein [Longimicrobium sp.]